MVLYACVDDGWMGGWGVRVDRWMDGVGPQDAATRRPNAPFHCAWRSSAFGLQRGAVGCCRSFQHLAGVASTRGGGCFAKLRPKKRTQFAGSPLPLASAPSAALPGAPVKADFCTVCYKSQQHLDRFMKADCPLGPGLARDGTACKS